MTETVLGDRLFVGGEWVEASATGETFDVVNPANGEVLATLPDGGREEMQKAIDAAAEVQREWGETTAVYRAGILREAARLMHERKEHLAKVMTLEQGKPLAESRGEIGYAASFVEWFAEEGKRVYGGDDPGELPGQAPPGHQEARWRHGRHNAVELPRGHDHAQAGPPPSPPAARR
jgi:succinate-semialdehyde dehydrogenase / glutarate-semialdehyde dehydrogenase